MTDQVAEFERIGKNGAVGVARLTREKPLNSLLLETIDQLSTHVFDWLADDSIACIVIDSSSDRAFCAGADITALYHSIKESNGGDNPYAEAFFTHEYRLNYALHTAKKPVLVWGNGIVMGGGLGLLGGCSHRIGTPSTRIAMPEITIGLFPDAGGTQFLSSLPDHLGLFAGLTGCQLSAADALELGLLDVIVDPAAKADLFDALANEQWLTGTDRIAERLNELLQSFKSDAPLPENLQRLRAPIAQLMNHALESGDAFFDTFEASLDALPASLQEDEWFSSAISTYRSGSPTTARIFLEQMLRARTMNLAERFRMELNIAFACIRHSDFPEGVRALLIDKDKQPNWVYKTAQSVPNDYVQAHFEPGWSGSHPLSDLG